VTGIRDVMSVPGNLAGESETQLFLDTATGDPVSLSVVRRPGMQPTWGVSWSEIVDQSARPPAPQTVAWYRPRLLPARATPGQRLPAAGPGVASGAPKPTTRSSSSSSAAARACAPEPLAKRVAAP
jgi:hypothetical protein